MAAEGDFLARYRAVSNKLKKRFLRKPNVAEASEQFGQLAKELKQQDCLQYAAFCNLAMARCEQTLFNAPGEALALTDAARLFLSSEKENRALQAPGFDEHLQAALNCYSFAIKVHIEMNQPVMAASLCLELGNALKEMNRPGEAIVHYQRAAELQTQTPIEALLSMGEMATCKILTRDYDGALSVFTEMQLTCQERGLQLPGISTPVGAFLDIVAKCEISRVLLLMLLEKATMLMLAGIVVLHITTIILLLVAAIDNAWWITDTVSTDLWGRWELTSSGWHYTNLKDYPEEYLQAVQATSVLACIFAILALFVFVAQLFTLPKGQRFTFTGILQLIACLCIMIAASIYTAELHTSETGGGYGHSYVLAWISFVLTFILAITYLVLRKKSE